MLSPTRGRGRTAGAHPPGWTVSNAGRGEGRSDPGTSARPDSRMPSSRSAFAFPRFGSRRSPALRRKRRFRGGLLVAVILFASDAGAQALGRLFSTPAERGVLDALRRESAHAAPAETEKEPARITPLLTVNGLVGRERGPDSVWINGERVSRGESTSEGFRVRREEGARVRVILPRDEGSIRLKAGQNVDLATGSIRDAYEKEPRGASSAGPPSTIETRDSTP